MKLAHGPGYKYIFRVLTREERKGKQELLRLRGWFRWVKIGREEIKQLILDNSELYICHNHDQKTKKTRNKSHHLAHSTTAYHRSR